MGAGDIVALGVSAAVGMSIFAITAPATAIAGPAMLLSLGLAVIPMAVFLVVYAFLGSAVPRSGSSYDWPARFVHPFLGFTVTWLRILGNAVSLGLMAFVFVSYLDRLTVIPPYPVMFVLLTAFFVVNLIGVAAAGLAARGLVVLKIVVLGTFVAVGLPHIELAEFTPVMPNGVWSVVAVLPLLVGLYSGIESAAEAGEEIRNGRLVIGKSLLVATLIGVALYFGTSIVTLGVLGPARVAASTAPLYEAVGLFLGKWASPMLVLTALASIASAINATYLIFARFLFAMGRDGALPKALERIHPRWGTPHVALSVAYVMGVLSLWLPRSLAFLFLAANVPTMLKYFSNCLAAWRLVTYHPDLHTAAAFRLSRGAVKSWAGAGIVCALLIVLAGIDADWRPYVILLAWGAIGAMYWVFHAQHRSGFMRARRVLHTPAD